MVLKIIWLNIVVLVAILVLKFSDCTVIQPNSAIVRSRAANSTGTSLFGYRVAVVKDPTDSKFYLLVSAPAAVKPGTNLTTGTAYMYPLNSSDFNTTRPINPSYEIPFDYNNPNNDSDVNSNLNQFGASMSTLPGGQFVICAPGYNYATPDNRTATDGLCAYWQSVKSQPRWFKKFLPDFSITNRMYHHCMGGFDAKLLFNAAKKEPHLVVSGPFCMRQKLAVISTKSSVVQHVDFSSYGNKNDYMGYSLATSRHDEYIYATSPHMNIHGDKIFFMTQFRGDGFAANPKPIYASQGTELYDKLNTSFNYIGYSSTTITCGNKKTAIVLGAPFEWEASSPDLGCVYIIPSDDSQNLNIQSTPIYYCGSDPGGRLGTSVLNIGDVNHDGSDDFAVGCPGCGPNKSGAIYLFMGLNDYCTGVLPPNLEPFDIINATQISNDLSGFGWSLASVGDLDGNGAADLATGAISSGHVVIVPCKGILNPTIEFNPPKIFISDFVKILNENVMDIKMQAGRDFDLSRYRFDLQVKLQEFTEDEKYVRFEMDFLDAIEGAENWRTTTRQESTEKNKVHFKIKFKLRALSNVKRHMPVSRFLQDVILRVQCRLINPEIPDGSGYHFPVVFYNNRLSANNEFELKVKLLNFSVCSSSSNCDKTTGEIQLRLLNESSITLDYFQPITVALLVEKTSSRSYYGGAKIRFNLSPGISVIDVTLKQATNSSQRTYLREQKEIIITEPFPIEQDLLTTPKAGKLTVLVRLNFDGRHASYGINFNLENVIEKEGYVTRDTTPEDNNVSMNVFFNTSLLFELLRRTEEITVVDTRERSEESALASLRGRAEGETIGPGLQHSYELYVSTKPILPVTNISLTVSLPFVTSSGKLITYFPRGTVGSGSSQLPGLPFVSNSIDGVAGNGEVECQPVEKDLVQLLFKPDLVLLEKKHKVKGTQRAKREIQYAVTQRTSNISLDSLVDFDDVDGANTTRSTETKERNRVNYDRNKDEAVSIFDCQKPHLAAMRFRCITFRCDVRKMNHNVTADRVFLHVHAKIWSPTFFASNLKSFSIKSDVLFTWPSSPTFMQVKRPDNSSSQQTFLFLNLKPLTSIVNEVPWGFVILAVFLAIWLLMLLILLLWYCNFFKRQKFDYAPLYAYNAVPQSDAAAAAAEHELEDNFYR